MLTRRSVPSLLHSMERGSLIPSSSMLETSAWRRGYEAVASA